MELDSLRERMQRIHVETEGRDEMRLLQQDREEGEGQGSRGGCTGWEVHRHIWVLLLYALHFPCVVQRSSWDACGAEQGLAFNA